MTITVCALALLGLAIGSFLNVVIARVPAGESIVSPPSHCPRCAMTIKRRHNVPVLGWLMLGGRCFGCELPISPRYPAVEVITAAGFALAAGHAGRANASAVVPLYVMAVVATVLAIALDADGRTGRLTASLYLLAAASAVGGTAASGSVKAFAFVAASAGSVAVVAALIVTVEVGTLRTSAVRRCAVATLTVAATTWSLEVSLLAISAAVLLCTACVVAVVSAHVARQSSTSPAPVAA